MSRRNLSQLSFVDAMMSGCGKVSGYLARIEHAFSKASNADQSNTVPIVLL
jgi:hypothetical protein